VGRSNAAAEMGNLTSKPGRPCEPAVWTPEGDGKKGMRRSRTFLTTDRERKATQPFKRFGFDEKIGRKTRDQQLRQRLILGKKAYKGDEKRRKSCRAGRA